MGDAEDRPDSSESTASNLDVFTRLAGLYIQISPLREIPEKAMPWSGRLTGIYIADKAKESPKPIATVKAVEGKGLEGDRYADGAGSWSALPGGGRHVTLIEEEALEAISRESKLQLPAAKTRRNLTTRGVPLNHLVGKKFRVGDVTLVGIRLCEPCEHMESLSGISGVSAALVHRGGLRAEIVTGGVLRVGDEIREA